MTSMWIWMICYGTRWSYWHMVGLVMNLFFMNMMMTTIGICNSMVHMMTIRNDEKIINWMLTTIRIRNFMVHMMTIRNDEKIINWMLILKDGWWSWMNRCSSTVHMGWRWMNRLSSTVHNWYRCHWSWSCSRKS